MFKKRSKKEDCPSKTPAISRAEEIAVQYKQLSSCCDVLSKILNTESDPYLSMYSGGWKLSKYEISNAGINIEEIYDHIRRLAMKRKLELEIELNKLA